MLTAVDRPERRRLRWFVEGAFAGGETRRANAPALAASLLLHGMLLALCTWTFVTRPLEQKPIRVTLLGTRDAGGSGGAVAPVPAPAPPAPIAAPPPVPVQLPRPVIVAPPKPRPVVPARPVPPREPLARKAPAAPPPAPPMAAPQAPAAAPPANAPAGGDGPGKGGNGGGTGSGVGRGGSAGVEGDPSGSALAGYLTRLRGRLESVKRYPALARRRGSVGTATVRIVIGRDGRPSAVALQHSSGSEVLDEEATEMVSRAAPFDPLPPELDGEDLQITVPVRFDVNS